MTPNITDFGPRKFPSSLVHHNSALRSRSHDEHCLARYVPRNDRFREVLAACESSPQPRVREQSWGPPMRQIKQSQTPIIFWLRLGSGVYAVDK